MAEGYAQNEAPQGSASSEALRARFEDLAITTRTLRDRAEERKDFYWMWANIGTIVVAVLAAVAAVLVPLVTETVSVVVSALSAGATVLVSRLALRKPARVWEKRFAVFREVVDKSGDRQAELPHLTAEQAARSLCEHRFAFFFAPNYHPAFKHIAPARKLCAERGQRTIFNFLGPLLNPAQPSAQLIGVPRADLCEPMARVLQMLGVRRGMVVSGMVAASDGRDPVYLDELSTLGETRVAEFYQERGFAVSILSEAEFPIQPVTLADLAGADRRANAEVVRRVLKGEERGPKRDVVLLNTSAALFVANRTKSLAEGWELAAELLDSGRANAKLEELTAASAA